MRYTLFIIIALLCVQRQQIFAAQHVQVKDTPLVLSKKLLIPIIATAGLYAAYKYGTLQKNNQNLNAKCAIIPYIAAKHTQAVHELVRTNAHWLKDGLEQSQVKAKEIMDKLNAAASSHARGPFEIWVLETHEHKVMGFIACVVEGEEFTVIDYLALDATLWEGNNLSPEGKIYADGLLAYVIRDAYQRGIPEVNSDLFSQRNPQLRNIFNDFGKFEMKKSDKGMYASISTALLGNSA